VTRHLSLITDPFVPEFKDIGDETWKLANNKAGGNAEYDAADYYFTPFNFP